MEKTLDTYWSCKRNRPDTLKRHRTLDVAIKRAGSNGFIYIEKDKSVRQVIKTISGDLVTYDVDSQPEYCELLGFDMRKALTYFNIIESDQDDRETNLAAYCKSKCNLDAQDVADLANVPRRTFYDWWTTRRRAVELIVFGIKCEREERINSDSFFRQYYRALLSQYLIELEKANLEKISTEIAKAEARVELMEMLIRRDEQEVSRIAFPEKE